MSLEKATINWSAKQLASMDNRGSLEFLLSYQRTKVWNRIQKTLLIHSMAKKYPIPPMYAKRSTDGSNKTYAILDGVQRITTISDYLNDKFALADIPEVEYYDEELGCDCSVDISGLKFSELPEEIQDNLNTTMFSVVYFDNLTEEEEREIFKRLNNGKPLSAKNKLLASCKDIAGILEIGSCALFEDMLSEKSRANKNQVTIVMKAWCMLNMDIDKIIFESKVFNPLVEETEITTEQKEKLLTNFAYIKSTHDVLIGRKNKEEKRVARKLYTETHTVSLVPFVNRAIEENIDCNKFVDFLMYFYSVDEGASISPEYNMACGSGSAKSMNICNRNHALEEEYEKFFRNTEE